MPLRRASKVLKTNDTSETTNSTIQLKFIQSVQRTFAKQYFKQLKLDFEVNCSDPYSKAYVDAVVSEIDVRTRNDALVLLKERRLDMWLHFMNKLVSSNQFVGSTLIQSICEVILTMNQKYYETSEKTFLRIQSACLLFESIVDNFPPSWSFCLNVYKKLMYSPVNIEIDFTKIRMSTSDGFFPILFALLDDAFKDRDNDSNSGNDNGFDSMMNFQQFEKIETEKSCYMKLSRTEKIDRLFAVLNLWIKLMEVDLSIWIQRYPFQTNQFMSNPDTRPLIAHLLWKGKTCGEVNMLMRDILELFTTSIWIDFPDDKTETLARLVNLMSVAVNLSEKCENDNLITYPNMKRLTENFASELVKTIEAFPYTVDFYINVIAMIRSSAIRMLVSLRILGKFTREFERVTLRKIFEGISNKSYTHYDKKIGDEAIRHRSSEDAYPTYNPKNVKNSSKHLKMYQDEYLTLVLHLFQSYIGVYRTHDLLQSFLSDTVALATNSSTHNDQFKKQYEKVQNEKNHRLDFDQITKDLKQLKAAAKNLAGNDVIPVVGLIECQNVFLDPAEFVERYQEDLEYLVKLKETIEQNAELYDTFKVWRKAVNDCLPNRG